MVPMVSKHDWAMLTSWPARVGGHTSNEMRRSSRTGMNRTSGSALQFRRSAILQESRGRDAKTKWADILLHVALVLIYIQFLNFALSKWILNDSAEEGKLYLHPFCTLFLSLDWCPLVFWLSLISQCLYVCVLIWRDEVRNGEVIMSLKKTQLNAFTFHRGNLWIFVILQQRIYVERMNIQW